EDIDSSSQVHSPHAAGLEGVGEAAFDQLAAFGAQFLAPPAADSPAVGVHRIPLGGLVLPVPPAVIGLAHVAANLQFLAVAHRLVGVIPLVGHCFLHRVGMDLVGVLLIVLYSAQVLLGLFHRLQPVGRVLCVRLLACYGLLR